MSTASELIADTSREPRGPWLATARRSTFRNKTLWGAATVKGTFSEVDGAGEITQAHAVDRTAAHRRGVGVDGHRQTRRPPAVRRLLRRRRKPR